MTAKEFFILVFGALTIWVAIAGAAIVVALHT